MRLILALLFTVMGGAAWGQCNSANIATQCPGPVLYKGPVTSSLPFNGPGSGLTGIPNSALVNPSMTIDGTTCILGSSCSPATAGGGAALGLNNALSFACGITIGDGGTHTVATAPGGSCFNGVTTLAGLAAITINGGHPFYFLTDNGTITGPLCTASTTTNCFLNGVFSLTNSSVANMDIAWLAIEAALMTGHAYVPQGTYIVGSTEALPLMMPLAAEFAGPTGTPSGDTLLGDGARVTLITAGHDFGTNVPLFVCGDPTGTYVNSLGRYSSQCTGDVVRVGFFKPAACNYFPPPGTISCAMTGYATGSRLRDLDVESSGFGVNYSLVGDHTEHLRLRLHGGARGLRVEVPGALAYGSQQFLDAQFDGTSIANIDIANGGILEANFNGLTYLGGGEYSILGEAGCVTPMMINTTFDNLFTEYVGNEFIADDTGFGNVTHTTTATNASPAVFTFNGGGSSAITFGNGNAVTLSGGTAPAGFTLGTTYYTTNVNLSAGTFRLAATQGGTAINSTSTGSGFSATTGVYTDANKCRGLSGITISQFAGSYLNADYDTTGSGRGRRASFDVGSFSMAINQLVVQGFNLVPTGLAPPYGIGAAGGPPAVAFINATQLGDTNAGIFLGGDVQDLITDLGALPIAAGDPSGTDPYNFVIQDTHGWSGSVAQFVAQGNYTTTVAGDLLEDYQYYQSPGGFNFLANTPVSGVMMQSGIVNNGLVIFANKGQLITVNTGWATDTFALLAKSTGIGKTITLAAGSGYTNGTYTWTATGGGCSTEPIGTVTVSGGALASATIGATTQGIGCTSAPTLPIPGGAGGGSGGSMTALWPPGNAVTVSTPLSVGFIGISDAGNQPGSGNNNKLVRLQGLQ